MNILLLNREFGPDSNNESSRLNKKSIKGALAALESFYYAFNNKDLEVLKRVWYSDALTQLNNPLGGIVRGIDPITGVYEKIFHSQAEVRVTFADIICYAKDKFAVFAGTEIGTFSMGAETIPLTIRTSRIFAYINPEGQWFQIHHHGSISNPELLSRYQHAVEF